MKFLVIQRPPYGEQMLGVFAGADASEALENAAIARSVEGRLTAFALADAVEGNVSIAQPPPPTATVELIV